MANDSSGKWTQRELPLSPVSDSAPRVQAQDTARLVDEKWGYAAIALGVLCITAILLVFHVTNQNSFNDCIAYGNQPAECAQAVE
jgi:uncharacterized protein YgiB involved in biofilm formation